MGGWSEFRMMGRFALTMVYAGFAAFAAAQDSAPPTVKQEDAKPSALIEAAKKGKQARAKKTKIITNADVKRARGKIIVLPQGPPLNEEKAEKKAISADQSYLDRRKASERLIAAEKTVAGLERELGRVEQNFYDANDPNYRDDVIQKRFEQIRRQLEEARKELADARDHLAAASGHPQ